MLWSLSAAEARAIGNALALDVYLEIDRHAEEETITARSAGVLEHRLNALGLGAWLVEQPSKQLWEGRIGADLGFLLLDAEGRLMKAAFVQAKRVDQLASRTSWCRLTGQCRAMVAELRHGSWVWAYDNP